MLYQIVRVKGQTQQMNVRSLKEHKGLNLALCVWFDSQGAMHQVPFPTEMLEIVTAVQGEASNGPTN